MALVRQKLKHHRLKPVVFPYSPIPLLPLFPHLPFPIYHLLFTTMTRHLSTAELEAGLGEIRRSPKDEGILEMIVCRPQVDERKVLEEGELDLVEGLVGDSWRSRGGADYPDTQLNVMNSRVIALVAQARERWQLAGDQLFIDLDLSADNLPPGTRLAVGSAIIEVTPEPHNGCRKFVSRFGFEAMEFVNSDLGKQLHLRGINAKVVQPGTIRVGSSVKKL